MYEVNPLSKRLYQPHELQISTKEKPKLISLAIDLQPLLLDPLHLFVEAFHCFLYDVICFLGDHNGERRGTGQALLIIFHGEGLDEEASHRILRREPTSVAGDFHLIYIACFNSEALSANRICENLCQGGPITNDCWVRALRFDLCQLDMSGHSLKQIFGVSKGLHSCKRIADDLVVSVA